MSHCPVCGYEQHCPCSSCLINFPTDKKRWIYIDIDLIKYANCGHTAHYDAWLNYAWKELEEITNEKE